MRLCARGSVKELPPCYPGWGGKEAPMVVVNWLLSPGGTRRRIAKSVRYSTSHEGKEMIREEDRPAWRQFWTKVIPFLVAVVVISFMCWGGK